MFSAIFTIQTSCKCTTYDITHFANMTVAILLKVELGRIARGHAVVATFQSQVSLDTLLLTGMLAQYREQGQPTCSTTHGSG